MRLAKPTTEPWGLVTYRKPPLPPRQKPALTIDEKKEWLLSAFDVQYFIEQHVAIWSKPAQQPVPFKLRHNQRVMLADLMQEQSVAFIKPRQQGGTFLILGYLLHQVCFTPNLRVALVCDTLSRANNLLDLLRDMLLALPTILRPGIERSHNRVRSLHLDNGSLIETFNISRDGIRGMGPDIVFVDEFNGAKHFDDFHTATLECLGTRSRIIALSTPYYEPELPFTHWLTKPQQSLVKVRVLKWYEDDMVWRRSTMEDLPMAQNLRWEKRTRDFSHILHGPQPNSGQLLYAGYRPCSDWTDRFGPIHGGDEQRDRALAHAYLHLPEPDRQVGFDPFSFQYLEETQDGKPHFGRR